MFIPQPEELRHTGEALSEICGMFCQRPQHHLDRITLLAYPAGTWVDLSEVLAAHTTLAKRLQGLNDRGVDLQAIHQDTPDGKWSLVSFYCKPNALGFQHNWLPGSKDHSPDSNCFRKPCLGPVMVGRFIVVLVLGFIHHGSAD